MNLTPKNIFKGVTSDGKTFTVEQYDFQTLANLKLIHLIVMIIALSVLSCIISPITLFIAVLIYNIKDHKFSQRFFNIFGIILSGYLLLDCYNKWFVIHILQIVFQGDYFNIILSVNLATLVCHTIMLLFNTFICKWYETKKDGFIIYFCIMFFFFWITYLFSREVFVPKIVNHVPIIESNSAQ